MKIYAFTFDDVSTPPDKQIETHSHSQWELSYVLCGNGIRTIGDTTEPIVEGEIILIPPNIPHVWHFDTMKTDADGNVSNISVFFKAETLERLSTVIPEFAETSKKIFSLTEAVKYSGTAYNRIKGILQSMRDMEAVSRLPQMIELLLTLTDNDDCRKVGRNNSINTIGQRLENIRIYCRCNYARGISLDEISAEIGMNKSSFCTFMKRHTGMTLTEFVNGIRLEKAKEMLRYTDDTIASIAYDVGFSNVTYFNRLFKKKYQCCPKRIRENTG